MFRIMCNPSSGSTELCLTEITLNGSQIFFVCLVGVWQRNFEPAVCVHCMTGWTARRTVVMEECQKLSRGDSQISVFALQKI